MYYIGLDLSTNTGVSVFKNGKLLRHFLVRAPTEELLPADLPEYLNEVERARCLARGLLFQLKEELLSPCTFVVEEVNLSRNRKSQKFLDFIHFAVLSAIATTPSSVVFMDTSQWRKILNLRLTTEDKEHNKQVKQKKLKGKITPKHLAVRYVNKNYGLQLKIGQNDEADAICLVDAFLRQSCSLTTLQ